MPKPLLFLSSFGRSFGQVALLNTMVLVGNVACATSSSAPQPVVSSSSPASASTPAMKKKIEPTDHYAALVELFEDWREFERPPLLNGVPDYTEATTARRHAELAEYRARLDAIDYSAWHVDLQVDWHIVRAEMNGFDFNCRVLQPWRRDPAFYKTVWTYESDVPAHEGPTNHALLEAWAYALPLSYGDERKFIDELKVIAPLLEQARRNLTGNARDLWVAGIRDIRRQHQDLEAIEKTFASFCKEQPRRERSEDCRTGPLSEGVRADLAAAFAEAKAATTSFAEWLEAQAPSKTGPSGVGKDNYTWYLQNVHLVPLTWEDEVRLLRRELERAWASLKLEEQRNKNLPPLVAAKNEKEYAEGAERGVKRLMTFLKERDVMIVKPNMEPALRRHLGQFVPEATRNFFWIGAHFDPTPLYTHFYHWWDLAQIADEPHPSMIRRGALLYNIFDSRAEGTATGVEEMFMHAGLYDDRPRVREIVWIMLAQRAARGLGSLYAHANEMTMAEAGTIHVEWTPRGWMKAEPELLQFEQHLYLRQPGYGTSYVTGKYLLERLLADYGKKREEAGQPFRLSVFFDEFNKAGVIPMSLIRWQMTGLDDEIKALTAEQPK